MRRWREGLYAGTFAYWLLLLVMTHIPGLQSSEVGVGDKSAHVTAFAILSALLCLCAWVRWPGRWAMMLLAAPVAVAYGAFDEATQPLFDRSGEIADWLADCVGVAIGWSGLLVLRLGAGLLGKRREPAAVHGDGADRDAGSRQVVVATEAGRIQG